MFSKVTAIISELQGGDVLSWTMPFKSRIHPYDISTEQSLHHASCNVDRMNTPEFNS